MLDAQFYNGFVFAEYHYCKYHSNDYTKGTGVRKHFFGKMKSGRAEIVTENGTMTVNEGDVFYLPKNLKYRSHWYPENGNVVTFYSLGFELFPTEDNQGYKMQKIDCTEEEARLLEGICCNPSVTPENIGRLYMFAGLVSGGMHKCTPGQDARISGKALEYMRDNTDYTVKDVADYCGISESGLYAMFRRVFDKTPIEVKHSLVAKKAVELLSRTDLSVEEISSRLSFGSSAYFRKVIYEQTGKTPREIRKQKNLH